MTSTRRISEDETLSACRVSLFEGLSRKTLAALLKESWVGSYKAGTLLFSAGDEADRFYVVLDGVVHIFALNADGQKSIIEIFGRDQSFAEAAMFASGRFPMNAETATDSLLIRVPRGPFLTALEADKTLAFHMLGVMYRRQLHMLGELQRLREHTPMQRLAQYFLALTDVSEGPVSVPLPHKKGHIASRIGIEPETFSRALKRLKSKGVETAKGRLIIRDVAALRAFTRDSGR